MPIRYKCRHCNTEIGQLPTSAKETVKRLRLFEIGEMDDFVYSDVKGNTTIHCICEQCEASLREFPNYYSLRKWLQ